MSLYTMYPLNYFYSNPFTFLFLFPAPLNDKASILLHESGFSQLQFPDLTDESEVYVFLSSSVHEWNGIRFTEFSIIMTIEVNDLFFFSVEADCITQSFVVIEV